jgi:hypothetical protein
VGGLLHFLGFLLGSAKGFDAVLVDGVLEHGVSVEILVTLLPDLIALDFGLFGVELGFQVSHLLEKDVDSVVFFLDSGLSDLLDFLGFLDLLSVLIRLKGLCPLLLV